MPGKATKEIQLLVVDTGSGELAGRTVVVLAGKLAGRARVRAAALQPAGEGNGEVEVLQQLEGQHFDLVLYLDGPTGGAASDSRPAESLLASSVLVGAPVVLRWQVPDAVTGSEQLPPELSRRLAALAEPDLLEALVEQRRRLDAVVDAMQDGVMVHDERRQVLLFNRAAERITGLKREQVLGRPCPEVFSPDGLCGSRCPFCHEQPANSFTGSRYELTYTDNQGVDRRLSLRSQPLELFSEGPTGVLVTFRDVTEVAQLRRRLRQKDSFHGLVAISESMHEVFDTVRNLATSDYPVLITGESGTGKELVARAIHNESRRAGGPFVPVNCGALPENILESELFGHVRGAFTGAIRDKKGRFELADGGTLFLDEVGELSPTFQVKLLRVLEQKSFEPVGAERTVTVDVRIVSATNRDLRKLVADGEFRADLFYRLAVVPLELPPLRRRREDLPVLVEQILAGVRAETGKPIERLSDEALDALYLHRWPGNVRELINVLQFASVRCQGQVIEAGHLPPEIRQPGPAAPPGGQDDSGTSRRGKLDGAAVQRALEQAGGNKVKAARLLGVGRATLYRFLSRNSLD